jgi:hypothetical protein
LVIKNPGVHPLQIYEPMYAVFGSLGSISRLYGEFGGFLFTHVVPPSTDRKIFDPLEDIRTLLLLLETDSSYGASQVEPSAVVVGSGDQESPPSTVRQTLRLVSV